MTAYTARDCASIYWQASTAMKRGPYSTAYTDAAVVMWALAQHGTPAIQRLARERMTVRCPETMKNDYKAAAAKSLTNATGKAQSNMTIERLLELPMDEFAKATEGANWVM